MPGWPGGLGNRLQDGRAAVDQGLGDRLQEPLDKRGRPYLERNYLLARIAAAPSKLFGGLFVDPIVDAMTMAGDVQSGAQPTMAFDPQTGETGTSPQLAGRALNAGSILAGGGLATAAGREGLGIFGGRLAKTADLAALKKAETLSAKGASRDEIVEKTKWFKGPDDKWRFEISDEDASFNEPIALGGSDEVVPLGERLQHRRAYEAYPDLKDIRSNIEMWEGGGGGMYGPDDTGKEALVASGRDPLSLKKTALHELQHAIQAREGFARGGNPNALIDDALAARKRWEDVEKPQAEKTLAAEDDLYSEWLDNERINQGMPHGKAEVDAFRARYAQQFPENAARRNAAMDVLTKGPPKSRDIYERLAGETEARNVSTRSQWADKYRRADPPWKTQDVPDEQQIVRFRTEGPQASIKAYHGSPQADITQFRTRGARGVKPSFFSVDEGTPRAKEFASRFRPDDGTGALYEVGINPEGVLDARKPEDLEKIRAALDAYQPESTLPFSHNFLEGNKDFQKSGLPGWGNDDLYHALDAAGHKGVLLDERPDVRSVALFDDKLISILRKYGLPISAAGVAALSQLHPQEAQAAPLGDRLQGR